MIPSSLPFAKFFNDMCENFPYDLKEEGRKWAPFA